MFKPLAIRPGIQCQMTKHCQFLSQANAYNFFLSFSKTEILLFKSTGFWHVKTQANAYNFYRFQLLKYFYSKVQDFGT